MTTGRAADGAAFPLNMSALAVRSRVRDAAAAAPTPMNFLLEISIWLQLVFVDLHRDFAVGAPPAAIHARRVERGRDVSFGIHHDHAATAMLLDELLHHDIIRGALDRHAGISNAGANVGSDDIPDEELSVTRAGHGAAQVVRIVSGADDRRIADPAVSLHLEPAGRCSGSEIS